MGLRIATAPTIEPVSLVEAKAHLHYDASDQDDRITALIAVARAACEAETNRAFLTQTWTLTLQDFPGVITVPHPPLQSVTSIVYKDDNGSSQTLAATEYQTDLVSEPGRIAPARNCSWPSTDSETLDPVTITYVAGWTAAASVPNEIKHAIKLLAGHWFEHLEAVTMEGTPNTLPFAVSMLLTHWKVPA
jgi:uncharacterized phiE125 gp8 family phage protein